MVVPLPYHIIYLHGTWNMNMLQRWFLSYEMQQWGTQLSTGDTKNRGLLKNPTKI